LLSKYYAYGPTKNEIKPTQSPIERVAGALSPGVNRPEREDDNSRPSTAEDNAWSYTSTPLYVLIAWCLVKYRDFTLRKAVVARDEMAPF